MDWRLFAIVDVMVPSSEGGRTLPEPTGPVRPSDEKAHTPKNGRRASGPERRAGLWRKTAVAAVGSALLVAGGVLLHTIADAARGAPVREVLGAPVLPAPSDPAFAELVGRLSDAPLQGGNRVELLLDDVVYDRLLEDIAAARESVTFFVYFCSPGSLGDRFAAALSDAAKRGVKVLVLADGYGCGKYGDRIAPSLRAAGARVETLRPVRWYALHRAQHRNHGRSVVIDGRVAYTGGFGIADRWIGEGGQGIWRETSVRFTGPAVLSMQAAFLTSWAEATGSLVADPDLLRVAPEAEAVRADGGDGIRAGILVSRPGLGPTQAERYFALTLTGARNTLFIANSYFVPTLEVRTLLTDAAARGVDVRILVPGPINDVPSTKWAGQSYFEELLEGGVRIFEYQPAMMHAKTLVVDGAWATVGSVNLDNRSMRLNEEWSLLIHDLPFGRAMDSIFLADLERARERTLETHRHRPFLDRVKELAVRLVSPLL